VCTVTPAAIHVDESNSTLKFASRAKAIKNKAVINEVYDDAALLRKMKRELGDLKRRNEQLEDGSQVRDLMQKQEVLQEALRDREEAQSAQAKKIQSLTRLIISASKLQVTDTGAMPENEVVTVMTVAEKKARAKRRKTWCPSTSALKHSGRLVLGSSEDVSKAERSSRHTRSSVMGTMLLEESASDAATIAPAARSRRRLAGRNSMMPALELGSGGDAAAATASGDVAGLDRATAALANLRALGDPNLATGNNAGITSSEGEIFKAKAQGLQRTLQSRKHEIEELESRLEMTTSDLERTVKEREDLRTQLAKQEAATTCEVEILRAELSDMRRQHSEAEAQASEAITRVQQHHERELREARENLEFLEHELLVYRSARASPAASPGGPDARATREEMEADINRLQGELATAVEEREATQKSLDEMNKVLEAMTEVSMITVVAGLYRI
jgi:DNA repair exonuclease SbcCD ATPase subunit